MATLKVMAPPGRAFPLEHNAKKYIGEQPVTVTSSAYYRRALTDGDLVLAKLEQAQGARAEIARAESAQADIANEAPVVELQGKTSNKKGNQHE